MTEVEPFAASLVQYDRKGQVASSRSSRSDLDRYLGLFELRSPLVYKAMLIEFIATLLNVFTSCAVVISSIQYGFSVPPLLIAIGHIIILGFFILASAKASGGHMNPMISYATMVAGLTTPARAVLYIIAQMAGAVCGAGLLKAVLDAEPFGLGGCALGSIAIGRALIAEAVGSCVLLFIAFGTALDTGQREVFGPVLGPFFVSITIALIIYFGGGLVTGYTGPVGNPARCFGPAVITGNYHGHWIYWVGALIAGTLLGLLYRFMPPGFNEIKPSQVAFERNSL